MSKEAEYQEDKKATKDTSDAGQNVDSEKIDAAKALSNEAFDSTNMKSMIYDQQEFNKAGAASTVKENFGKGGCGVSDLGSFDKGGCVSSDLIGNPDFFMREFPVEKTDGTHDFKTGDRLVVKDGKETLSTPNGDVVTVGKDGSVKIEGDVKEVENKNGQQVYTMADGATITIGKYGISEITRDGRTVTLAEPLRMKLRPILGEPIKDPWGSPKFDLKQFENKLQNR